MSYTVIDKAWSDVGPGNFIRWATPRFVKFGVVICRKGTSMTADFLDEARPRSIPDARWYFCEAKMKGPDCEEHLVVIDALPDDLAQREILKGVCIPEATDAHAVFITVNEAVEMLRMDPKQLRRYIRRGVIPAHKDRHDGMWRLHRERLRDVAVKHGWL